MATENTTARYSFYASGSFTIIEGRLGADPEIKTLDNGKRLVKLSIAVNAGSKKKDDGTYENLTEWNSVTIWDNGGASTLLIDTIAKPPSDKLVFQKGNQVVLYCHATKSLRVYNDKPFCDITATQFYHLYKVLSNGNGATKSEEPTETATSKPKAEFDF